jgi:N-acetylglucosamine-6-phosphate deacetylase
LILPYVYGLGGRDIQDRHFDQTLADMMQGHEKTGQTTWPVQFLNVRE